MKSLYFSTAGFKIKLQSEHPELIALDQGFLPFVIPEDSNNVDIIIQVDKNPPISEINEDHLIFEASQEKLKFFSICKTKTDSLKFIVYDQGPENKIQQIAFLDKDFLKWRVFCLQDELSANFFPLKYPFGPLVLYYLTLKHDAIIIHASGIYDGERGRLFTGFSGRGKSTMAKLWQQTGSQVINDDRLIIRFENGELFMYNTPMFYPDIPKKTILNSIHIISHAKENEIKRITGASAASKVLAFCIQHNYKLSNIEQHLSVISKICEKIPVFEVGFKPDLNIVEHIKNNAI